MMRTSALSLPQGRRRARHYHVRRFGSSNSAIHGDEWLANRFTLAHPPLLRVSAFKSRSQAPSAPSSPLP
jgi:hypothetical protein